MDNGKRLNMVSIKVRDTKCKKANPLSDCIECFNFSEQAITRISSLCSYISLVHRDHALYAVYN